MGRDTLTEYDYDFLMGEWEGPFGAAYNSVYEWCRKKGYCDAEGKVTELGKEVCKYYAATNGIVSFMNDIDNWR